MNKYFFNSFINVSSTSLFWRGCITFVLRSGIVLIYIGNRQSKLNYFYSRLCVFLSTHTICIARWQSFDLPVTSHGHTEHFSLVLRRRTARNRGVSFDLHRRCITHSVCRVINYRVCRACLSFILLKPDFVWNCKSKSIWICTLYIIHLKKSVY